MDRLEMLNAAKALASEIVATHGTDGDAKRMFLTEAVAQFSSQLGSSNLLDVWNDTVGIDPKTGLRVT